MGRGSASLVAPAVGVSGDSSSNRACGSVGFIVLRRSTAGPSARFIEQPIDCGLRLCCCSEKRPLLVLQQFHPKANTGCVIAKAIRLQAEMRAKDRGAHLSDELFCRHSMRTERFAHAASKAMRAAVSGSGFLGKCRCGVQPAVSTVAKGGGPITFWQGMDRATPRVRMRLSARLAAIGRATRQSAPRDKPQSWRQRGRGSLFVTSIRNKIPRQVPPIRYTSAQKGRVGRVLSPCVFVQPSVKGKYFPFEGRRVSREER